VVLRIIKKKLKTNKTEVKLLEQEMEALLKTNERGFAYSHKQIPGLGQKTALALVASTNSFREFKQSNQLSSRA